MMTAKGSQLSGRTATVTSAYPVESDMTVGVMLSELPRHASETQVTERLIEAVTSLACQILVLRHCQLARFNQERRLRRDSGVWPSSVCLGWIKKHRLSIDQVDPVAGSLDLALHCLF